MMCRVQTRSNKKYFNLEKDMELALFYRLLFPISIVFDCYCAVRDWITQFGKRMA